MAKSTEELEPLFDYSRVQPFNVVCLDDDSPPVSPIPIKTSNHNGKPISNLPRDQHNAKAMNFIDCEEDDWLLPPPSKVSVDSQKLCENATIKELRLKKQELVSLTRPAEDVLQTMEDSSKGSLSDSLQPLDKVKDEASKSSERVKIVISMQSKDGQKQFRVFTDDKFEKIFKIYADKIKFDVGKLTFRFDGDKISTTATPHSLGMEDNDIVEVHIKS